MRRIKITPETVPGLIAKHKCKLMVKGERVIIGYRSIEDEI